MASTRGGPPLTLFSPRRGRRRSPAPRSGQRLSMLQWALLVLAILFVIVAYIVIQGTRAALAWRRAAAAGDAKGIGDLVEGALNTWRSMKRPKQVPAVGWGGHQST